MTGGIIGGPPMATPKAADATSLVHRWDSGGSSVTTGGLRLVSNPGWLREEHIFQVPATKITSRSFFETLSPFQCIPLNRCFERVNKAASSFDCPQLKHILLTILEIEKMWFIKQVSKQKINELQKKTKISKPNIAKKRYYRNTLQGNLFTLNDSTDFGIDSIQNT